MTPNQWLNEVKPFKNVGFVEPKYFLQVKELLPKLFKVLGPTRFTKIKFKLKIEIWCDPERAYFLDRFGKLHTLVIEP